MDQLRCLRVFAQVIAEGSFAGAARTLDIAPAVVTRAVSDLEFHLGVRLLNRTTRSLALTEVGEEYLARAKRVLAELDDADAMANAVNGAASGNLRILCPPAFATHQLVLHLPTFRQRFPYIQLEILASYAFFPIGMAVHCNCMLPYRPESIFPCALVCLWTSWLKSLAAIPAIGGHWPAFQRGSASKISGRRE